MIVNGITSINLPALEKRFQLSSKDLGLIAASNDISGSLLGSFVSFYGQFGNKIKWLGNGMLITGQLHWRVRYLRTGNIIHQKITLQGFLSPKNTRALRMRPPTDTQCSSHDETVSLLSYANALKNEYQKYPKLSAAHRGGAVALTLDAGAYDTESGKTLDSQSASCHPGVQMCTGKFNVGSNLAIY